MGTIILYGVSFQRPTDSLLLSMGLSARDNLRFPLTVCRFGFFEDVDQVLAL